MIKIILQGVGFAHALMFMPVYRYQTHHPGYILTTVTASFNVTVNQQFIILHRSTWPS